VSISVQWTGNQLLGQITGRFAMILTAVTALCTYERGSPADIQREGKSGWGLDK
jgi:hypothetical protein